ncbi:hypothetical protein [Actinoplanes sp. NPDC026670]|jgi:hypothetical protein|uniref:hypothetical protein n=1 Tax=Actinoplanes sp. NPDC026670 TaxID=3154700 RepID=UPI00340E36E0
MSSQTGPYDRWRRIVYYGAAGAIGFMTFLVLLTLLGCLLGFFGIGAQVQTGPGTGTGYGP